MISKIKPYFILNIGASFLMQLVALVLVYILSPEEYGYYALITSAAQIMFILCSGWSNATVLNIGTRRYQEKGSYKDVIYYRSIIVIVCFVVLSLFFLILKTPIIYYVGSEQNYHLTYTFFFGLVAYDFAYQLLYPGENNNLQAGLVFIANLLIFLYVIFYVSDISQYIYFYAVTYSFLFILIVTLFVLFYRKVSFIFDKKDFRYVLTYSFWQLFGVLGVYLVNLGTNYVLRMNHIDVGEIGLYNFAYKLFSCFVPVFALIGVVIPKWLSDKKIKNKKEYIFSRAKLLIILLCGLYILLYFILPPFLRIIHKEDYLSSSIMYISLLPGFVFYAINQVLNVIVLNTEFYRYSQFIALTQGVVLLLFSFVLVHLLGMAGAIVANSFSFFVGTILLWALYNKRIRKII